jgi:hypothetical protein
MCTTRACLIVRRGWGTLPARDPHVLKSLAGTLSNCPDDVAPRCESPAGGGYFRLFPYALAQAAFRDCDAGCLRNVLRIRGSSIPINRGCRFPATRERGTTGLARTVPRLSDS